MIILAREVFLILVMVVVDFKHLCYNKIMPNKNNESMTAFLSNRGKYTIFSFDGKVITFLTSKNLECYTKILKWDNGYIEVMAKNKGKPEHEDYIDLQPILENLYMNPKTFLSKIKHVEVQNA